MHNYHHSAIFVLITLTTDITITHIIIMLIATFSSSSTNIFMTIMSAIIFIIITDSNLMAMNYAKGIYMDFLN
ncbi:hypothetical protein Cadr_000006649 [Camelus dromedarius]|uniref:Uncharacterized protein n=1 Tax=Camelus dromedarius TaxID=9838 RepID=A0A5N4E6W8_CAMDR|nr:hypothetical protein Cadr_000006649 [Camelus dromedarius]